MKSTLLKHDSILNLPTPAILVDETKLQRNISAMQRMTETKQFVLRPDISIHNRKPIGKLQLDSGAYGLSTSSVDEAFMLADECDDWFIREKIKTKARLDMVSTLKEKCRVVLSIESYEDLENLESYFGQIERYQDVMIKFDAGLSGEGLNRSEFLRFCQTMSRYRHLRPIGIYTLEAPLYQNAEKAEAELILLRLSRQLQNLASQFEKVVGYPPIISVSSTVTAILATSEHCFHEVRPGSYIFGDHRLVNLGIMTQEELSLSIMAQVISNTDGKIRIDVGHKTLPYSRQLRLDVGLIVDDPSAQWIGISETSSTFKSAKDYKEGDKIEIIPKHTLGICGSGGSIITRQEELVLDRWEIGGV